MLANTKVMGWQRIKLTRQEYESGEVAILMGAFRAAYIARNGPEGMAMFGSWNEDGDSYFVYTTPKAFKHIIPLLQAYSARQMSKPDAEELLLIYGDEGGLTSEDVGFEA